VLRAALNLFAENTFAAVSMDDIAAAAGIATSTLYHYFPSKVDLLSIALERGNGYLQLSLDRTLHEVGDEAEALRRLIASYCHFAFAHPAIVDLLITRGPDPAPPRKASHSPTPSATTSPSGCTSTEPSAPVTRRPRRPTSCRACSCS
jgi:AcrR family transcriptional regulator